MVKLKMLPCDSCPRNKQTACKCGAWKAWFIDSWRRVQNAYGVETPEREFIADRRTRRGSRSVQTTRED